MLPASSYTVAIRGQAASRGITLGRVILYGFLSGVIGDGAKVRYTGRYYNISFNIKATWYGISIFIQVYNIMKYNNYLKNCW